MATVNLIKAAARSRAGKGAARAERRTGRVPGIIYGDGKPPLPISLDFADLRHRIYAGHFLTTIHDVEVDGVKHRVIPRDFQLDPVRVYLFERTSNDKWLGWGKVFIQSLTIERKKGLPPTDPAGPINFKEGDWVTSGTYRIIEIYDPEYQKIMTMHEAPKIWSYFPQK